MKRDPSWLAWVGIAIVALLISVAFRFIGSDGRAWQHVIAGDGVCHHAYLSSLFIHGTLDPPVAQPAHLSAAGDGHVIKCTVGVACMQAPFYAVAHLRTLFNEGPEDGRSLHYQLAVALAAWCYLVIGLWAVRALLLSLGTSQPVTAAVLLLLFFGTGLAWYALMEPSMVHVYGFCSVACTMRAFQCALIRSSFRWWLIAAAALGLVVLVRPVNALMVLALPLVWSGTYRRAVVWNTRGRSRIVLWSGVVFALVLSVQPILWYAQSGSFFVELYPGEGFNWSSPRVLESLFGAQKGLFFYWPLLLLIAPGAWVLWRRDRGAFAGAVLWFALLAYVLGSWWNHVFADSYGLRPYVDHLAVFALVIAPAISVAVERWGPRVLAVIIPFLLLQCAQAWQYGTGIIQPQSMDAEKYRYIFLHFGTGYAGVLGGCAEPGPYAPCGMRVLIDATRGPQDPSTEGAGAEWTRMEGVESRGPGFRYDAPDYPTGKLVYVEMDNTRRTLRPGGSAQARVVCTIHLQSGGTSRYSFRLDHVPDPPAGPLRTWRSSFVLPAEPAIQGIELAVEGAGAYALAPPRIRLSTPHVCAE